MNILKKIEMYTSRTHLSLFSTLYVNFRLLSFHEAISLPIYIYGKCNICDLSGKVEIKTKITRGMIKFGYRQGFFSAPKFGGMLMIQKKCKLVFNGPCMFDYDYVIRITDKGQVTIGKNIGFGSDTKIYCEQSITIGNFCRIPYGSTFMDTNYHYSIDTISGCIYRKSSPILIGNYNWIGNTSTIMKGTITSDGCIIASKSHLNKDYSKLGDGKTCLVLAGSPAKIVRENSTRIMSLIHEKELNDYFDSNPTSNKYEDVHILNKVIKEQSYIS